jgi:Fe-S-cluster containining protein
MQAARESDRAIVAGGLDVAKRSVEQILSLMRVMHGFTEAAKDARSVTPLMEFFYLNLGQTLARVGELDISCRKGCSHCCHSWVAASAPEVLHVLKSADMSAAELHDRIEGTAMLTGARDAGTRLKMRTPCPMLKDDACGVYEARPLVCRTHVSFDVSVCVKFYAQESTEPPPVSAAYSAIRNVYALALSGALKRSGLTPFYYEYNAALRAISSTEDAEARWLSGENLLEGAQQDDGGDMFTDDWNRGIYRAAFG